MEGCLPPPPQYDRPFPQAVLDEQEAPMLTWLEVRGRAEPVQVHRRVIPQLPGNRGEVGKEGLFPASAARLGQASLYKQGL